MQNGLKTDGEGPKAVVPKLPRVTAQCYRIRNEVDEIGFSSPFDLKEKILLPDLLLLQVMAVAYSKLIETTAGSSQFAVLRAVTIQT